MSKKFGKEVISKLQKIRWTLDNMENCEDFDEAVHLCQELSCDIEGLEEKVCEKFKIYDFEIKK